MEEFDTDARPVLTHVSIEVLTDDRLNQAVNREGFRGGDDQREAFQRLDHLVVGDGVGYGSLQSFWEQIGVVAQHSSR